MNRKVLFWPLAAMLLTACEKGLVDGVADVAPADQVMNSVLQVRTRSGGSAGEEATVAYPIAVRLVTGTGAWVYPDACPHDSHLHFELSQILRQLKHLPILP